MDTLSLTAGILDRLTLSASWGEIDDEPAFSPMLARPAALADLRFSLYASPKLDGIRCIIRDGRVQTREGFDVPNAFIRAALASLPDGLDGEIITYTDGRADCFELVQSKVLSADGAPVFMFHAFDDFSTPEAPYSERLSTLRAGEFVSVVPAILVEDLDALMRLERQWVDVDGYEGVMVRAPGGHYKFGRSTVRQGLMLKIKRFLDDEAEVVAVIQEDDAARVGAWVVVWRGVRFKIGAGGTAAMRAEHWRNRASLAGKRLTFRYRGITTNGTPRNASFVAIRSDII